MTKRIMDIWDGDIRVFFNFMSKGVQYTLGYPKKGSGRNDVWVGKDGDEIGRVSFSEANQLMGEGFAKTVFPLLKSHGAKIISGGSSPRQISEKSYSSRKPSSIKPRLYGNKTGRCVVCGKKLHGNTAKTHCSECYHKYC